MEPPPTAMEKKKQRVVVFWPLLYWLLGGGLSALGCGLGPLYHVVARAWLYAFIPGVLLLWTPMLVLGRDSLWLGYLCGLYWKRIRRQNIVAVIDFYPRPGSPWFHRGTLCVRTSDDGLYELPTTANRWKQRLAEALHDCYGVKIDPQPLPPYHQLK